MLYEVITILHGMNPERILIAAESVGLGRCALARAAAYAKERIVVVAEARRALALVDGPPSRAGVVAAGDLDRNNFV